MIPVEAKEPSSTHVKRRLQRVSDDTVHSAGVWQKMAHVTGTTKTSSAKFPKNGPITLPVSKRAHD